MKTEQQIREFKVLLAWALENPGKVRHFGTTLDPSTSYRIDGAVLFADWILGEGRSDTAQRELLLLGKRFENANQSPEKGIEG